MRDETRNRLPQRQMAEEVAAVCLLGGVVVLASLAWLALAIGDQLSHLAAPAGNPASALVDVVLGRVRWTAAATVAFVGELVGVGAVVGGVWWVVQHHSARRLEVDRRAQRLPRSARSRARYVDPTQAPVPGPGPGLVVGVDVVDGAAFRQSWEDVAVMVAGSRTGKTTSQVAPAIRSAPGAVYACSNKRDIVDLTNQARTERRSASGTAGRLWLFDPQQIATDEPAAFWWNPLDMARDVAGARTLAGLFAAASRPPGAQRDAYFDSEGEELVALLLLAAALDDKALPTVYRWLTQGWDRGITDVLADHGHRLAAEGLQDVAQMPDKQKAGVVGTARKNVAFLADPALAPWITDVPAGRPRFRAQEFASTPDTLYSLSKEGPGSAGALTGALTAAVVLAAEHLAASEPDGRLEVPLVCVLDEVANVCRWRDLPDLYSHYGSRGIILMSYLQSWSQGVAVWGEAGMTKLWGAANIRIYGGSNSEREFLGHLSSVCGDMDRRHLSTSYSPGGTMRQYSTNREPIFDVARLAAWPLGRVLVMASGADPVVLRTVPVFTSNPTLRRGERSTAVPQNVAREQEQEEQDVTC